MRKIFILFFISFSCTFAKIQTLSNIAPVSIEYINLETGFCGEKCLKELADNDMLASFMARFEPSIVSDAKLLELYALLSGKFIPSSNGSNKIAVIIPQKVIKSYSQVVTNALIAYIAQTNAKVELKFIMSNDESPQNITNALNTAREGNFSYIIAPLTRIGAMILMQNLKQNEFAYIPTIHVSAVTQTMRNVVFGGVDYKAQIAVLSRLANEKIVAFSDASQLGNLLNDYARISNLTEFYDVAISGKDLKLDVYLNKKSRYNNSTMFLNLPVIKASLIATQVRGYEISPYALLSTQINFIPNILSVIAERDRQNLYIANSINVQNDDIDDTNALFQTNLKFNWIAYSSSVGIDYIYSNFINNTQKRLFKEEPINSQMNYTIQIFKADGYKFEPFDLLNTKPSESIDDSKNLANSSSIL
ncbi:hypothetical protein KDE13_06795 [Campylobacter sp. faydin G-140]|uniref:hypothetical protein n=1 Tax=Campylobacter anatolicus TaxID=2829105 RepID=UPI001B922BE0|nr:hypothetical protein [Campylobacter anatolicus]MBR8462680.1 hypothetical protein [Campylobacter anatolicus]MBR8466057.1 hypothetical protein [Campylobacter anatolicus]